MKTYLVGGAVRDQLLGLPVKEKDWVVVGATQHDMLQKGFRQVGKDFPVFLHPETNEEYALARTERKIGPGYTGFAFNAAPNITLEDDLKRRDLTINAIAQTPEGEIIDPYHGRDDLEKKLLRHVSPAFAEDPVRILRLGRFAARFGFQVAPETIELMRKMVDQGEVDALVAERVWKELERALLEKYPEKFFEVLVACGANQILFPQIAIPGPGIQALLKATQHSFNAAVRFAALLHTHSENEINALCKRYRIPSDYRDLVLLVSKNLSAYQHARQLNPDELLNLLLSVDAFRRESRFKDYLLACEACSATASSNWLQACYQTAKEIDTQDLIKNSNGKEIAQKIKEKRRTAIGHWLQKSSSA